MHPALAIAAKDLRQKVRDRSAIIISVLAPLALAFGFSSVLAGDQMSFSAHFVVVDLDHGPIAAALVDGPLGSLGPVGITVTADPTETSARAQVADGKADVAIVVPGGFSAAVQSGRAAQIRIVGDVNRSLATQVAQSVVEGFASSVTAVQVAVLTVNGPGLPNAATLERAQRAVLTDPSPLALKDSTTRDRVASSSTYYAAAMAILFVFFAVQFGVVSIHAERRQGMLARMLAGPVSPRAILLGKLLVSLVLGVVSLTLVVVGSSVLMKARWGDPWGVAALIVAAVVAASGITVLVVGATKNEEQAGGLSAIVAMVLAVLGGSFFPLAEAPESLARLSVVTPHAWFLRGVNDLASGEGVAIVLPSVAVLLAMGVVTGGIGLLLARRTVVAA
jgi:ABC-2 type transport system permease protein